MKSGKRCYSLIRLTLQKRTPSNMSLSSRNARDLDETKSKINNSRAITVLGYYDRLIFENISNWYSLRPGIENENSFSEKFSNEYTLRLVVPNWAKDECNKCAMHENFDYRYFEKYGSKKETWSPAEDSINEYPILAALLINCFDKELEKISKASEKAEHGLKNLFNKILNATNSAVKALECTSDEKSGVKPSLESLKIGIYLSLGYSEFVLLIAGTGIHDINWLIDRIRLQILGECASSTYTVLGFDETLIDSIRSNEKINATIDFSLRPGQTLDESDFLRLFVYNFAEKEYVPALGWDELGKKGQKKLLNEAKKHGYIEPVMLLGAIDWRWEVKDCALERFLRAYEGVIENAGTLKSFGNDSDLFKVVHTNLQFDERPIISKKEKGAEDKRETEENNERIKVAYKDFNYYYTELFNNYFVHRRSLQAIHGIKNLYDRVVGSSYGGDVKRFAEPFFFDFLNIMNRLMALLNVENKDKKTIANRENFLKKAKGIDIFLREKIQKFREFFEPYLFAIYRSDHAFFEGQSLVHPSIGSAAKLLFCYNQVLYSWERTYRKWAKEKKNSDPNFHSAGMCISYLVTSGGVDSTDNWDIFDTVSEFFSSPTDGGYVSRPLVVMMSEAGLYNIEGTLFKLAHEFFHKRGHRMRKQRALAYIKDICFKVAEKIADEFVDNWLNNKIRAQIRHIIAFDRKETEEENLPKEIHTKIEDIIIQNHLSLFIDDDDERHGLKKNIREALLKIIYDNHTQNEIINEVNKTLPNQLYSKNLRDECRKIIKKVWKLDDSKYWKGYSLPEGCEEKDTNLRNKIACKLYELGKDFSDKIYLSVEEVDKAGNLEKRELHILSKYFEIDPIYIDESLFVFDRHNEIIDAMNSVLQSSEDFNTWEVLAKECFADCLAIKTMQNGKGVDDLWGIERGLLSYLRTFLFEVRNPDEQWKINYAQMNSFWIYRIYILKKLFRWSDGLEFSSLKKELETWYDTCFYPEQHNVCDKGSEKYANYVIETWSELKKAWRESAIEPFLGLIEYLEACIKENMSLCELMKRIHISALRDGTDSDKIKIYSQFVFEKWMEIYKLEE